MHPWIGLSDDVRLSVLTEWVTSDLVDRVLADCGRRDQRPGALPARFTVYYTLALALFQQDSYDDVAEDLVGAIEGMSEAIPNKSSFTRARQRLGAPPLEALFRQLAGPVAPSGLYRAYWRGMRVAAEPSWTTPFTGLSPHSFGRLVAALRREGAEAVRRGRPWGLSLENRVLLVTAYWCTNLTMRQLAPLFGISKSAADRIIGHLGPLLALRPRQRFAKNTVLIVDGTLVPTRDHAIAEQSKNYRYSANHQVVIDADTRRVVVVGRPLPGNRNDCRAWEESGAKAIMGQTMTIADGGYPGTGLVMPHRRRAGEELPDWKRQHNRSHKQVRARVEHTFARMKTWKILRDCRLKGDGVHHAMLGVARLHNLNLAR